jgi:hypothetical protein
LTSYAAQPGIDGESIDHVVGDGDQQANAHVWRSF